MLQKEHRKKPTISMEFFQHLKSERGTMWFPNMSFKEIAHECSNAILDPKIGAITEDHRSHKSSTHSCIFVNSVEENIALVLGIDDKGAIMLISIKNIAECEFGSSWFYDQYEKIAKTREMQSMTRIRRPKNENT